MNTKNNQNFPSHKNIMSASNINRRTILKALAGLPVAGLLGFTVWQKNKYDADRQKEVLKALGLENIQFPIFDYGNVKPGRDLIRVGIIGFGARGRQLAKALGFMHPDEVKK